MQSKGFYISTVWCRNSKENFVCLQLLGNINCFDDRSIINLIELSRYDLIYRTGKIFCIKNKLLINNETCHNIRILVKRTLNFFDKNNFCDCTLFFDYQSNNIIKNGDADYLSKNTIWDLKTSKYFPSKEDTFQVFMYYLLAKKCKEKRFDKLISLGIFNPRLNMSWKVNASDLNKDLINYFDRVI